MGNGAWSTDFIEDENTCYTFTKDGIFSYARKNPNTRGGAYPVDTCWIRRNRNSLMR